MPPLARVPTYISFVPFYCSLSQRLLPPPAQALGSGEAALAAVNMQVPKAMRHYADSAKDMLEHINTAIHTQPTAGE